MATFDQRLNLETSQNPVFIAAKIIYLAGFIVLMFALIGVYGLQSQRAGRLGVAAFAVAIVGTMMLAGDLWFESFAVPWLAAGPGGQGLASQPSLIMALGSISSYALFALAGRCLASPASGPVFFLSLSRSRSSSEGSPDFRRCWRLGGSRLAWR
jgi:hypothetical protein